MKASLVFYELPPKVLEGSRLHLNNIEQRNPSILARGTFCHTGNVSDGVCCVPEGRGGKQKTYLSPVLTANHSHMRIYYLGNNCLQC